MTARKEAPGCLEMRIGGLLQGLARLSNGLVERRNQFRARVQWSRFVLRSVFRSDIQLVQRDGHTDPRWNVRDQIRQVAELHRPRVRLPIALARWDLFEDASRLGRFALELCQKPFSHHHTVTS